MRLRFAAVALMIVALIAPVAVRAIPPAQAGGCPNNSKLLNGGPTLVFGEGPNTYWGLLINGLLAAGIQALDDQIAYLNHCLGTDFDSLDAIQAYNLQLIDGLDKNGNGYVCVYELRGTRTSLDSPFVNLTYFTVGDDLLNKKN